TSDLAPVGLRQLSGRILLDLDAHPAPERVRERALRVCGVASAALAYRVPSTLEAMKRVVGRLIEGRAFASFRISARRAFKTYPLTSVELNRELGAFVLERVAARVDLREPELEIHVEVMPSETFVYVDPMAGPGGLPVGASGTVAALLSGGIDSPVAAWRMMKRGCRVAFVHFQTPFEPDADCCTLFVPTHPATRMSEDEILTVEARLDVPRLVAQGRAGAVTETFEFPARAHAAVAP